MTKSAKALALKVLALKPLLPYHYIRTYQFLFANIGANFTKDGRNFTNFMEYYIAVFKSRIQTMKFNDKLKKNGFLVSIINTPRQASLGCGLSIKFSPKDLNAISRLIAYENLNSFGGIFKITGYGHTLTVRRYNY